RRTREPPASSAVPSRTTAWPMSTSPAATRSRDRSGSRPDMASPTPAVHAPDPAPTLWAVAILCWTASVVLAVGDAHHLHHGSTALPGPAQVAAYAAIWVVMVGAMMLPTTVPMARLLASVSARVAAPGAVLMSLYASYLAVWSGFGVLALAGDVAVRAAED